MEDKKHPIFVPTLTKEQKKALSKASNYRGKYISAMVNLEYYVVQCVVAFFNGYNSEKILSFMYHFLLYNERFNLGLKVDAVREISNLEFHNMNRKQLYRVKLIMDILSKLVAVRNVVAHLPFSILVTDEFGYTRPKGKHEFLSAEEESTGAWRRTENLFIFNKDIISEIDSQIKDAQTFLDFLSRLMQTKTDGPEWLFWLKAVSCFK